MKIELFSQLASGEKSQMRLSVRKDDYFPRIQAAGLLGPDQGVLSKGKIEGAVIACRRLI